MSVDTQCFLDAVENDDWNSIHKLVQSGCPMDVEAYKHAQNFQAVKNLYDIGCPIDESIFTYAVFRLTDQYDYKYIYSYSEDEIRKLSKFCPMSSKAYYYLMREKRKDIIKLLIEVGCPTDHDVLTFIFQN